MQSQDAVEIADRNSRKRAYVMAAAGLAFLVIYVVFRPYINLGPETAQHLTRRLVWVVNVVMLLLCLLTGGGILTNREIRALVNDEVSQSNYRTSVILGFWVAMVTALALYVFPRVLSFMGDNAIYTVVTLSVAVAVLKFAYLEYRAHRDA
jgi:hypothetical protein